MRFRQPQAARDRDRSARWRPSPASRGRLELAAREAGVRGHDRPRGAGRNVHAHGALEAALEAQQPIRVFKAFAAASRCERSCAFASSGSPASLFDIGRNSMILPGPCGCPRRTSRAVDCGRGITGSAPLHWKIELSGDLRGRIAHQCLQHERLAILFRQLEQGGANFRQVLFLSGGEHGLLVAQSIRRRPP